jgi:hypothetical protein
MANAVNKGQWIIVSLMRFLHRKFVILDKGEMVMIENRNVEVEERHIEKKSDSSMVAATFIKYFAYIVIFFGLLYFLVRYVFPMF